MIDFLALLMDASYAAELVQGQVAGFEPFAPFGGLSVIHVTFHDNNST